MDKKLRQDREIAEIQTMVSIFGIFVNVLLLLFVSFMPFLFSMIFESYMYLGNTKLKLMDLTIRSMEICYAYNVTGFCEVANATAAGAANISVNTTFWESLQGQGPSSLLGWAYAPFVLLVMVMVLFSYVKWRFGRLKSQG